MWVISCVLGGAAAVLMWRLAATARIAYNVFVAVICVVAPVLVFLGRR